MPNDYSQTLARKFGKTTPLNQENGQIDLRLTKVKVGDNGTSPLGQSELNIPKYV